MSQALSPTLPSSVTFARQADPLTATMDESITLRSVQEARVRIAPFVKQTPLISSQILSQKLETNAYLKLELFQKTGSFKVRGAFNKILTLSAEQRARGVVAVSGGNHAQAVAYAATSMGMRSRIFMPESTPQNYLQATRHYGAEVCLLSSIEQAFAAAREHEGEGWIFIHPFDDPLVMAGQGTLGLEIIEDLPNVTDVIVSIGGGGLASGVATAIKSLRPQVRLWGVETEGADAMSQALAAGRVVELPRITSIARTLGAPAVSELTLRLVRKYLEGVTVVSDREAVHSLLFLLERVKVLTEPAASCTLAAAERLAKNFSKEHHVVLILCGGNMGVDELRTLHR